VDVVSRAVVDLATQAVLILTLVLLFAELAILLALGLMPMATLRSLPITTTWPHPRQ
jgi:hypothetical protein